MSFSDDDARAGSVSREPEQEPAQEPFQELIQEPKQELVEEPEVEVLGVLTAPMLPYPITDDARRAHEEFEARRREWAAQTAVHLQSIMVHDAEDVSLINEMMCLKEEVVCYFYLKFDPAKGYPLFPLFYSASVYWMHLKNRRAGRKTVYLRNLGDVVTQRVREFLPATSGNIVCPSFDQIAHSFWNFESQHLTKDVSKKMSEDRFEILLGESWEYIMSYSQQLNGPPHRLQFLLHFCQLYYATFPTIKGVSIESSVIPRLRRNLPHIDKVFFDRLQKLLRDTFRNRNHAGNRSLI